MRLSVIGLASLIALASCSRGPSEARHTASVDTFTGTWRATTKSYEHLRLTVNSLSSHKDVIGMRLTFSGVAWEGVGSIDGDSLVMVASSSSQSGAKVIAHPEPSGSLRVQVASDAAAPLTLIFVRGD